MLVWLKIKTTICNWCKKYWQILVGFFGALIAIFAFSGNNRGTQKILDAKNELRKKEEELDRILREEEDAAIKENIEKYFKAEDQAKDDLLEKLKDLDDKQRDRVKELLESNDPQAAIVEGLRRFLD